MRQPQVNEPAADTYDDIFGPPRTNSLTCTPPRHRITMISATYRKKEERRKVLKISLNKLKSIEDPEANLCRSVLINNTTLRLQQESREEKKQKQKLNYPQLCDNDIFSNISSEMLKCDEKETPEPLKNNVLSDNLDYLDNIDLETNTDTNLRKRKFEENAEETNEEDVLSQFLITPTPTMVTEIDDKHNFAEDKKEDPLAKRLKLEEEESSGGLAENINFNNLTSDLFASPDSFSSNSCNPGYTCGQASMYSEPSQNNFYYNLVASLET